MTPPAVAVVCQSPQAVCCGGGDEGTAHVASLLPAGTIELSSRRPRYTGGKIAVVWFALHVGDPAAGKLRATSYSAGDTPHGTTTLQLS